MSTDVPLFSLPATIRAAEDFAARARGPLGIRRAVTATSTSAVASMAVLVIQFEDIVKLAAASLRAPSDLDLQADLTRKLQLAGYLSIQEQKEHSHGEG